MKKLFEEYPVLENDAVILRKMTEADAERLSEITSLESVYATLPTFLFELRYPDKTKVIEHLDDECLTGEGSLLLGIYPADEADDLVGIAEIYNYEENKRKASIGYRIDEVYQGKGIATAVTALLTDYLTNVLGLKTITAHVLSDNKASARVLSKNGFVNKYPGLYEDWGFEELMLTDKYAFKAEWEDDLSEEDKLPEVKVEQFVMAYEAEQDRIRALLPDGYTSLRPVLRINTEIRNDSVLYIEFNTPVEADGRRGWLNIANWKSTRDDIRFKKQDDGKVTISSDFLELSYKGIGLEGGCPAEKDNEGDAEGVSLGKTLPANYEVPAIEYPKTELSAVNAAAIPCRQVLGAYIVRFTRRQTRVKKTLGRKSGDIR
jgi:ribosomal-protein-alanine N-acetyltransferase